MVTFNDYVNYIKSGIYHPIVKIQWLRVDESVESEFTTNLNTFSITKNVNNGVRSSLDIELRNELKQNIPNPNGIWINRKFRIFTGFEILGEDYFFSQGIYVVNNPNLTSRGSFSTLNINAMDKACLYDGQNGGILQDLYIIDINSNFNTAIKSTIEDAGEVKTPILQATTILTPYDIVTNRGDTYWTIVGELATAMSRDIYFDNDGHLRVHEMTLDAIKPSAWDFNFGEDAFSYLGSNLSYEFDKVFNAYQVIGDNINGAVVYGYAENRDLSSPFCIQKIGYKLAPPEQNQIIQTNAEAQRLAEYRLMRSNRLNQSASMSCVYLPHLKEDDLITITDDNLDLIKERFIINNINSDGKTMTINATRYTDVDIVVG
jgi:hypothetical protein